MRTITMPIPDFTAERGTSPGIELLLIVHPKRGVTGPQLEELLAAVLARTKQVLSHELRPSLKRFAAVQVGAAAYPHPSDIPLFPARYASQEFEDASEISDVLLRELRRHFPGPLIDRTGRAFHWSIWLQWQRLA